MKRIGLFVLAALFLVTATGCAGLQEETKDAEVKLDKFKAKYNNEIRPQAVTLLKISFGVDGNGEIDTDVQTIDQGEPGVQDIIAARLGEFSEDEQRKLIRANMKAKELYLQIKKIDQMIQEGIPKAENFLSAVNQLSESENREDLVADILDLVGIVGKAYVQNQQARLSQL